MVSFLRARLPLASAPYSAARLLQPFHLLRRLRTRPHHPFGSTVSIARLRSSRPTADGDASFNARHARKPQKSQTLPHNQSHPYRIHDLSDASRTSLFLSPLTGLQSAFIIYTSTAPVGVAGTSRSCATTKTDYSRANHGKDWPSSSNRLRKGAINEESHRDSPQ